MADRTNTLLAFGLLAAIGAYLLMQSDKGKAVAQAAIDAGADVIGTVTSVFSGPRGIRNNNPGNIVRTNVGWQGMSADQSSDSRFVVFDAPEYGIRAMARVLKNYIAGGYVTVQSVISRWAPPSENDTSAYVNAVAQAIGVSPTAPIDASAIPALISAIIYHENGQQPYPPDLIARGVQLEQTA